MTNRRTDLQKKALTECLVAFRDNLIPMPIRSELYSKKLISEELWTYINKEKRVSVCAEEVTMFFIQKRPESIQQFIDIVKKYNDFLAEKFNEIFLKLTPPTEYEIRKPNIFTKHRKSVIAYRHELKRLAHLGEEAKLYSKIKPYREKWISINKVKGTNLADFYFMSLDAVAELRLVKYDRALFADTDFFEKLRSAANLTTEPVISELLYHARRGYAQLLAGYPLDECLPEIDHARGKLHLVPACRETGIVLYIHFNMRSNSYEKNPTQEQRQYLLDTADRAIEHFSREDETMGKDYKRIMLIKQANLNLGIGVFGNEIDFAEVTHENIKHARDCLTEVSKPEYWERIEVRWKMFYYIAMSRINEFDDKLFDALRYANKALKCNEQGRFSGEENGIQETIERLQYKMAQNINSTNVMCCVS